MNVWEIFVWWFTRGLIFWGAMYLDKSIAPILFARFLQVPLWNGPNQSERRTLGMIAVAGCLLLAAGAFLLAKWVKAE